MYKTYQTCCLLEKTDTPLRALLINLTTEVNNPTYVLTMNTSLPLAYCVLEHDQIKTFYGDDVPL